jgi:hypothetical protein
MSKILFPIILVCFFLNSILVACGAPATQNPIPETETAIPVARATETEVIIPSPTEVIATLTPTPEFAPFCEPAVASTLSPLQCQVPIAEQSSTYCTNKIPYNLILINEGATYEVLGERIECSDAGTKDGKQIVACTGPIAEAFELRVCDPACAPPTLQAEITQCPQDYSFDSLRGCCTQELQETGQNCVLLSLVTKSCVINCNEISKQSACEKNSACTWDNTNSVCQVRE